MNKRGFVFIETIIVVCVLTISLMTLYANYSKIMANTKELNTFDTTEYNYKTYFIKKMIKNNKIIFTNNHPCLTSNIFDAQKICKINTKINNSTKKKFDAYIIDYLNNQQFDEKASKIVLVEYKKQDSNDDDLQLTYISSLTL